MGVLLLVTTVIILMQIFVAQTSTSQADDIPIYNNEITGLKSGEMSQSLASYYPIHMAIDKREPKSILFNTIGTVHSYSTTDDKVYNIARTYGKRGYANGLASEALFDDLTGFFQFDHESVVLVGYSSNCLRLIYRPERLVSDYAGMCNSSGFIDGPAYQAKFSGPTSAEIDRRDRKNLIVTDRLNNALRLVSTETRDVTTLIRYLRYEPLSIAWHPSNNLTLYVSCVCNVINIHLRSLTYKIPMRFCPVHERDSLYDLIWIQDKTFILADYHRNRILVHNMENNTSYSICKGKEGSSSGSISECELKQPRSLLKIDDHIYIGYNRRMRRLQVSANSLTESIFQTATVLENPKSSGFFDVTIKLPILIIVIVVFILILSAVAGYVLVKRSQLTTGQRERRDSNIYDDIVINQMSEDVTNPGYIRSNLYDYPRDENFLNIITNNRYSPKPNNGDYSEIDEHHAAREIDESNKVIEQEGANTRNTDGLVHRGVIQNVNLDIDSINDENVVDTDSEPTVVDNIQKENDCAYIGTARQDDDNPNNGYVTNCYYEHVRDDDVSGHTNVVFDFRRTRSLSLPGQMSTCLLNYDFVRSDFNATKDDFHYDYADVNPRVQPLAQPTETRNPTHTNFFRANGGYKNGTYDDMSINDNELYSGPYPYLKDQATTKDQNLGFREPYTKLVPECVNTTTEVIGAVDQQQL